MGEPEMNGLVPDVADAYQSDSQIFPKRLSQPLLDRIAFVRIERALKIVYELGTNEVLPAKLADLVNRLEQRGRCREAS